MTRRGERRIDPERRDPFRPDNPDDPIGVLDPRRPDPVTEPSDPITLRPGLPYAPDPPAPAAPPTPPPGHPELITARAKVPAFANADGSLPRSVQKAEGTARAGRDSFADLWIAGCGASLDELRTMVAADADDQDKLDELEAALGACRVAAALEDWRAIRDSEAPDLQRLAEALTTINDELGTLIRGIDGKNRALTGADVPIQAVAQIAKGILRTVAAEADTILSGARVPLTGSGEALCGRLESRSRDSNWRQRLNNQTSWAAVGREIGNGLKSVLTTTATLNETGRTVALKALDQAIAARDTAAATGEPPYSLRASLVAAYTGAINAIHSDARTVGNRIADLDTGAPAKGWTRQECQRALDLLNGSLQVVHDELAADALTTDPDLGSLVRKTVSFCETSLGPTSQEALSQEAQTAFRKFWTRGRDAELKGLKKLATQGEDRELSAKAKALQGTFTKDFAKSLDQWAKQLDTFPDHDRTVMHDLALRLTDAVNRYRNAVMAGVGATNGAGLLATLDALASGLAANIRAYQHRGGLF